METLVICIDRDNDLGEKAHVITPVIGRGANITAAVNLATADPEDSDTNTIFGGIRILDELRSRGVNAEIVSFAGDRNVGLVSDKKITDQLDDFLKTHSVGSAIFVSDGAEDESLIPLVQSRIRIDGVHRIIVMQSENLESTYYMIKNFLRDPKFLQTFLVPIGLALIMYAISLVAGYPQVALIGTLFLVGLYMILRGFQVDERLELILSNARSMFSSRNMSIITTTASALVFVVGTVIASLQTWRLIGGHGLWYYGILPLLSYFINLCIWWYAGSVFLMEMGIIVDKCRAGSSYLENISEMLFALAIALIIWTSSSYVVTETLPVVGMTFPIAYFIYSIVGSIIIGIAAIYFGIDTEYFRKKPEKEKTTAPPPKRENTPPSADRRIRIRENTDRDQEAEEAVDIVISSEIKNEPPSS